MKKKSHLTVEERVLWERFKEGDLQAKEELVQLYLPLVRFTLSRLNPSVFKYICKDDVECEGLLGLMEAIDKFDPDKGIKFTTFALKRIRGAMIDYIRKADWKPRKLQAVLERMVEVYDELQSQLQRVPTDEEIAEGLGVNVEEYYQALFYISSSTLLSLDQDFIIQNAVDAERVEEAVERKELVELVKKALEKLPERELIILELYYNKGLTLKEIAKILHLTESRISQLHTKAVLTLRKVVRKYLMGK